MIKRRGLFGTGDLIMIQELVWWGVRDTSVLLPGIYDKRDATLEWYIEDEDNILLISRYLSGITADWWRLGLADDLERSARLTLGTENLAKGEEPEDWILLERDEFEPFWIKIQHEDRSRSRRDPEDEDDPVVLWHWDLIQVLTPQYAMCFAQGLRGK